MRAERPPEASSGRGGRGPGEVPGRLVRLGFSDPVTVVTLLDDPATRALLEPPSGDAVIQAFARSADPTLALGSLVRLLAAAEDRPTLVTAVLASDGLRSRLAAVLGSSAAFGEHLVRHPEHWHALADDQLEGFRPTALGLRDAMLVAVGADPRAYGPRAAIPVAAAYDALRVEYRRLLLRLAARDLDGHLAVGDVAAELADLAGATLDAGLAVARADVPGAEDVVRLAVVGMGKCGGRELNYVSDVDVIFVAEPLPGADEATAMREASRLAAALVRACSSTTREGTIWPVDAALRPEGSAGPLVRSLASHRAYYERWAKTWEFQALVKARPVAGDRSLGAEFVDTVGPMVWQAASRPGFVADVQAMRRRVEQNIPANHADRQLKLGPGGLRDVEFAVQLLQLVHGRGDETLRSGTTLVGLEALSAGGYVGREDAAELRGAYEFLRTLEHRIQVFRLRRTHLLPEGEDDLRRLGRSMGLRSDPARELREEWRRHTRDVRRRHEKLFYRPLLSAVARLPGTHARLTPEAAGDRLVALGYVDPAGALRHLEALTAGVSRAAAIQRTLLPVLLGWFADGADPDAGLLAFRRVSEALGSTHWYLRLLRDEGAAAERLAHLLASSRFASDLLLRQPDAVATLADDDALVPRAAPPLELEVLAATRRADSAEAGVAAVRAIRRREVFRVASGDVLGMVAQRDVEQALTTITRVAIRGALDAATRSVVGSAPARARLAVVGMGRLGGGEQGYGSDADVLFVYEPALPAPADERAVDDDRAAADEARAIANELRRLLGQPGADPALGVDADLRPEGRQGPLVRSLDAYQVYYARWSHPWETQALLRATPVAGDADLGVRFMQLVDPLRWPVGGVPVEAVREIRRIKARVESERLPRGKDPKRNVKLGPGGLADVEWTVQLLQLLHAGDHRALQTTGTLTALTAAGDLGLVSAADADALREAWVLSSRSRNAIVLAGGRAGNSFPSDGRALERVARLMGHGPGESGRLIEDHLRTTRRARAVVDRVFYA